MALHRSIGALVALALAGCSDASEPPPPQPQDAAGAQAPTAAQTAPAGAPGPTVGGDGSDIRLEPLTGAQIEAAALEGELGCSFGAAGAAPLLVAMGNVASADPAFGLVSIAGHVERLASPGGFDALIDGARFGGRGTIVTVALTGPALGGGESPPRPATLTVDRADGARRSYVGRWSCGP